MLLLLRYEKLRENAVEDYGRFVFKDYAAWLESDKILNNVASTSGGDPSGGRGDGGSGGDASGGRGANGQAAMPVRAPPADGGHVAAAI